jgi:hypothetical protein
MVGDDDLHADLSLGDELEIKLRTWAAEERMVEIARRLTEQYDLDPSLVEDLEDAHRRGVSEDWLTSLDLLLRAAVKAKSTE